MNFGSRFTPVSFFTPAPVPPPPATVTAANNGVSLSGTTVVLGNNVGAVGDPAQLLNSREIVTNNFTITFKNVPGSKSTVVDVGLITLTRTVPALALNPFSSPAINASLVNNAGSIEIQDAASVFKLKTAITTGNTEAAGTIKTGNACLSFGDGPKPWALGNQYIIGGLLFDQQNLVEVCIDGNQVLLACALLPG